MAFGASAVIAACKRCDYVLKAVRSAVEQAYPVHEVIVVVDGSINGTVDALRVAYSSVLVVEQPSLDPSIAWNAGVPYVEAMACGTPVVATHNAGAREVLDEGRFGVLCNDDELSAKLVWLLRTEEARRFYEEMGVERARRFDWQRVTTDYLAAYRGETWAQD